MLRRYGFTCMEVEARAALTSLRWCSSAPDSTNIYRPPHYRKPHQYYKPQHMLQEEFPNAGDASGAGIRLFDYFKTAELVNQLPTIQEKIEFVSPYERPWTRPEKIWRRAWHPSLMSTRKAWALPLVPKYFDCLKYYQYITKTRLVESSLDSYYAGLVPPTARYESLCAILRSDRFDEEDKRVSAILSSLVDEAIFSVAHNVPRLGDYRVAYDVQSESFWIRSGFMFLYDTKPIGSDTVVRNMSTAAKFTGDDRRKLGELAFVSRDRLAVQLRSKQPLAPLHSLESEEACRPLFPEDVDINNDVLFSPKVMNLWPDENPLWQCPGYFVESEETHVVGRFGAKSLSLLDQECSYWDAPEEESRQMWQESAKAQAVASLFTTLCAQAHTAGFTQYTDVTRPFTSQIMLSNGIDFIFAIGQLNTLAINIECDGFENPRANLCCVEPPIKLYDDYREGKFYHITPEGEKAGLNSRVLLRILQMLLRD
uniref:28S ribosomal protein S30, mitochondrial n=1 Tax=Angiostrongylus cantonensis TaxID=6313 RepID=A0A0K0DMV7_ANGCA